MSGTPTSAFGSPLDELGDAEDVLTAGLDEEPDPSTDEAVEEIVSQGGTETETETEEVVEEASTETEATSEPEERLLAGKYRSAEDLERGYREQSTMVRQHAERARALEEQNRQIAEAATQVLRQLETSKQQPPAPAPEPTDAQLAAAGLDRETWRALAPMFEQQVEARVAPVVSQLEADRVAQVEAMNRAQAEAKAQAEVARARAAIEDFRGRHPEFAPNSERDSELYGLITEWNIAWSGDPNGQAPGSFNPAEPGALDIAAEALARPELAKILKINPSYFDSDEGMELARRQATLLEATAQASTQPAPAKSQPKAPHVESGASGGGSPLAAEGTPTDPIAELLAYAKTEKEKSVFSR